MERSINDASLTKLGDIYQYYRALLDCFSLKNGESLLIEVHGDISILSYKKDRCVQKEIKHHIGKSKLSDRHKDFWNTIKNWIVDLETSKRFEKLEFYTTASIPDDCKLFEWNQSNKDKKYEILFNIGSEKKTREEKFRELYNSIFNNKNITKKQIKNTIAKVTIIPLQEHIEELDDKFDEYISFYIPPNNRRCYIEALLGTIIGKIKYPPHRWEITKDEFDKIAQIHAASFVDSGKRPLTNQFIDLEPSNNEKTEMLKKRFVSEIHRIEFDKRIPQAIDDYWKMNNTVKKYYDDDPTFNISLLQYRKNIKRKINDEKDGREIELRTNKKEEKIFQSKKLYINVMKMDVYNFGSIIENQPFFQCGVIHDIVDEGEFVWYIGEEDEH